MVVVWSYIPGLWVQVKGFGVAMNTVRAVRNWLNTTGLVSLPGPGPCIGFDANVVEFTVS